MRAIILCGGSGSRLWPESRESLPKQFISIFNNKSLLDLTVERVLKITQKNKPIFICNKNHGFLVKETLNKYDVDADIFLEPEGKNTCAAIYLAAKHCSSNDNLIIMPADHIIPDKKEFLNVLSNLDEILLQEQWITLGIKPTKASDAYGYIKIKKSNSSLKKVIQFIEKPTKKIASEFIKNEDFFWNAGIFIAKANTIINSTQKHAKYISKFCDLAYNDVQGNTKKNEFFFSKNSFSKIPSQSIDYAIMEKEENTYLYPFNSEWSDVGSWDAIAGMNTNKNAKNKVVQINSNNNFIRSKKRTIATIGIKDLIIIDSDNATLIAKKSHTEKVKQVVNKLIEKKWNEGTEHSFEHRPWGKFEILLDEKYCKVKKILVDPKKRLSLQYHNHRSEHWLIVKGIANVYLDGKSLILRPGQSIDIPQKSHHYVENKKNKDLIIIETQLGSYFGEDDIIRLDDPYFRND